MTDEETGAEISQLQDGQWDAHIPGTLFGGTYTSKELALADAREFIAENQCQHRYTYARLERQTDESGWEIHVYIYRCKCGFEAPVWFLFPWEVDGPRRPGVWSY
jgi:hypothetical protein